MLPETVRDQITAHLPGPVCCVEAVGGGCIANASRVETGGGSYFLKWSGGEAGRSFLAEATGLAALRAAGSPLHIPEVIAVAAASDVQPGFLLMEWVEPGEKTRAFWDGFGHGLAGLHRHAKDRYGFDEDNRIGRLPQHNGWTPAWPAFFRERRIAPQVATARAEGRWQRAWDAPLDGLYARLDALLPERPEASIVHGDLWSGNFLPTAAGTAALIDPAAYYGHRETDLALTELFGGYDAQFYAAYREAWPLEPGYETRREVYNLYHLINHLNHFGGGYARSVQTALEALR